MNTIFKKEKWLDKWRLNYADKKRYPFCVWRNDLGEYFAQRLYERMWLRRVQANLAMINRKHSNGVVTFARTPRIAG